MEKYNNDENLEDLSNESLLKAALKRLRDDLRMMYGGISIRELASNPALSAKIDELEKLISKQVVAV